MSTGGGDPTDATASLDAVVARLARLHALRGAVDACVAERFGATRRLIVYGSLVPGGSNHHELAELPGSWTVGSITGELVRVGRGAALGYPALRWHPAGPRMVAHLLEADGLPAYWPRLDEFEGEEYRRVLLPFFPDDGGWVVGQAYVDGRGA